MKKKVLILVLFCTTIAFSQEKNFEEEVLKISKRIELITQTEKAALKEKVEKINLQVENKEITSEEAQKLKKEAADFHADKIAREVALEEQKLQLLVQEKANGKIKSSEKKETDFNDTDENSFTIGRKTFRIRVNDNEDYDSRRNVRLREREDKWEQKGKRNRSTTTQFVFAMGVNNVLVDNKLSSLETSNYQFWQSHFYELGWTWKTRMDREASKLYFKYGVSFLWNNLRLKNNMYHVVNGNMTDMVVHPENLSESRLRHVQMNFPVHFEWDFSNNGEYSDGTKRDRTNQSLRLGIGAFAGFKLGTRQYIEYVNSTNVKVEELQKDNFNMNIFNYGVSAYLAYRSTGFYVKYDMNPLFKNTDVKNISLGVRFDFN
jgi:hypothetical protein